MTTPSREPIENRILLCRGRPVLPAADLAAVYGLSTSAFLDRVQRQGPLPGEFAFFADPYEPPAYLRDGPQGRPPLVFSELGALAAAYLVGSETAIAQSVEVLRAFARFRPSAGGEHAPDSWPASEANRPRAPATQRREDHPRSALAPAGWSS